MKKRQIISLSNTLIFLFLGSSDNFAPAFFLTGSLFSISLKMITV